MVIRKEKRMDELLVEVKEATSKGFAVARGAGMQLTFQCREARREEEESG